MKVLFILVFLTQAGAEETVSVPTEDLTQCEMVKESITTLYRELKNRTLVSVECRV